jgi:hypothetical protein
MSQLTPWRPGNTVRVHEQAGFLFPNPEAGMPVSYIAKTSDYWLRVQLDRGPIVSVPYGLKIQRTGKKEGREYFTILEGVNQGKLASIHGAGAEPRRVLAMSRALQLNSISKANHSRLPAAAR